MFIHASRNTILKAQQIGMEQGLRQGLEQREEIGRGKQPIATARQLFGLPDWETISRSTGLRIAELQALRED
jgi:hypothetical protein